LWLHCGLAHREFDIVALAHATQLIDFIVVAGNSGVPSSLRAIVQIVLGFPRDLFFHRQ